MDFALSLRLIGPELVISVSGLILLLVAAWGGEKSARLVSILASAALFAAGILLFPTLHLGLMGPDTWAFAGQFRADAFSAFAKALIYLAAIGCLMVAPAYFERLRAMKPEYPVLMLLAVLGASIMVSSGDFMTLYIGLELNSLAAYVLAAYLRNDSRSAEAGLKYFVLGALASGILLYGMSLLYGFTGTTSFEGVRAALSGEMSTGMLFGVIFVLSGLAFKIAAVPFHMWTPDVYEGAPTPVTTFFATSAKAAAIALIARVALDPLGAQVDAWRQIVIFAALASIVVGALGAIGQQNLKRLLAYSSINNVGFILIGLATATVAGASAMMVYIAIYLAMTLGRQPPRNICRHLRPFGTGAVAGLVPASADVQPCRYSAIVRLLGQIRRVPGGGRGGPGTARRHRHRRKRDRCVLLHQVHQGDVLRCPGAGHCGQERRRTLGAADCHDADRVAARLFAQSLAGRSQ